MSKHSREEIEKEIAELQRKIEEAKRELATNQVTTGDNTHQIRAESYIENQFISGSPKLDSKSLRTAYLNYLFKVTNYLPLANADPKMILSEVDTRLSLDSVYVDLQTRKVESSEFGSNPVFDEPDDVINSAPEYRLVSAVEQLNRHQHLVLLGEPGSGKSTFVNFITLCFAGELLPNFEGRPIQANLSLLSESLSRDDDQQHIVGQNRGDLIWKHGAMLPVRVILREFAASGLADVAGSATAQHLWDFIEKDLEEAALEDFMPHLRNKLEHPGGLLLLDGLDEALTDAKRNQIIEAVEDFAIKHPHCRIVATCRTYTYHQKDWRRTHFHVSILAPFSEDQVRRFVERWYAHSAERRHISAYDARMRTKQLNQSISENEHLRSLAERPCS